jgi:hypothetical protein
MSRPQTTPEELPDRPYINGVSPIEQQYGYTARGGAADCHEET